MTQHPRLYIIMAAALGLSTAAAHASSTVSEDFSLPVGPYTTAQFGTAPPATILPGGPAGDFMRLANAGVGGQHNFLAFDRSGTGAALAFSMEFNFRMGGGNAADGIGISLLNTAIHGNTGANTFDVAEEPNFAGSLGIGLDTWDNGLPADPNDNHISLHWNGGLLTTAAPTIDLNDNAWHSASLSVDLVSGIAALSIDSVLQFSLLVPGLSPYELRPQFGARTGGFNDDHDIDEIVFNVTTAASTPDGGATAALLAGAALGLAVLRRSRP